MRFRGLVLIAALALLAVGIGQLRGASVEALPEFSPAYVEVQTEALGLSAYEVEQLITVPLEVNLLNGVAWLDEIRSNSVAGLSSVEMIFEPGTDLLQARQMVQERLGQAGILPNVSKPPTMLQPLSSANRVAIVGLSAEALSLIEMSVLARWNIKPRLMGVPGVANVAIWGQRERQLQVQVDPDRLAKHGVSLNQVISTTGNALWSSPLSFVKASTPGSGGFIDTPQQRLGIQHISPIKTAQDLAKIPVEPGDDDDGKPVTGITLGDVGTVVEDHQPLIGDSLAGDGQSLMLVVEKFPGADTLQVTRGVEEALAALRPGLSGMELDSGIYRPATFVESARANLALSLSAGLALLVLIVGAALLSWRAALVTLVTVPVSLAAALLVLQWRGEPLNTVMLAGLVIALAVVVHDAVADVHHVGQRRDGQSVLDAVHEQRSPLLYATLVAAAAAVPALLVPGLAGRFLGPLVLSYLIAVAASLLAALTVTPALACLLFRRTAEPREGRAHRAYRRVLGWSVPRPGVAYALGGVILILGLAVSALAVVPRIGGALLPAFQDRDLLIGWQAPPGTSQPAMVKTGEQVRSELKAIPGVRGVAAHVGRAVASDQVVGINSGMLWVGLTPEAPYEATLAAIGDVVRRHPGFDRQVRTYHDESIGGVLTPAGGDVVVRVYGQDLTQLAAQAEKVRTAIAGVAGVRDPRVELQPKEPAVEVEVNVATAQQKGLKPGDVRRAAATWMQGIEVGSLFENQKVFEVVVVGAPATRQNLDSIGQIKVDTPDGEQVRLSEVAEVRVQPNQNVFKHEGTARYYDVVAELSGGDREAVIDGVGAAVRGISFPMEYHAEVLDRGDQGEADWMAVLGPALAALVAIVLLLQAALSSWRLAALIVLSLPVALSGTAVVALLGDGALSVSVLAAMLAVLALAVRIALLMFASFRRLTSENGGTTTVEQIVRGAGQSLVPVITTAIAVAVAVLPLLLLGGVPGHEVARPLVIGVLGGLVTTVVWGLAVLPALYLSLAPRKAEADPDADLRELVGAGV
ncbi:efflux RND transporter permease subunit [Nonomuraea endophytica]|uniref:Cu/Ag efflux pump CusA n=1 Tax=Nonomuraea endophytica TaxID=714136 RepID=A0A7W8AB20_9ACTN|nr:efflux RND transporter permease subunit [Nonomuraea endophytica]MBB5081935.1 Cu/Ag efflux pump CusA [Nonomuraea endophytica]